jgi:predicted naringenin-chalcone synthase
MKWPADTLQASYQVLKDYGNMSSPTILFVLRKLMQQTNSPDQISRQLFGAAFGPGLTMETFIASY